MSQQLGSVVIALKAVDEASAVMRNIFGAMDSLHGITSKLGGGFAAVGDVASATFKGFAAGGPIGAAIASGTEVINQAVDALKWCVGEAAASEQAMKNLSIAVEKSGIAWDSVKEGTTTALADLQKFTTYSDEQVAGALEKLLTFGLSYDDAMKALGSTVDLAAAKHMDLESAATIVGKAMDGNIGILKRYGIDVTTAKDATAALKTATDTVAASLEANKGSLDGFKDSLGDMGVKVNDADGKMRGFKDIAKDLVGLLAAGKIDTAEYGQTLADLGINVDTLKLSAADADDVLAALNTQFGGTAQEQSKTYAATQERLKNVMSDLGERIGGIFLPALTSMNEGMIGITDSFNKGFDAIGAWLGEVGKIPEIKAATDAVSGAFDSLNQWFQDLGKTAMEVLGPALDEIWNAFKEVWDALQPAREAFDEICTAIGDIFAAITGGMGEGSFDAFKLILQAIILPIRGIAEAIKLVIPVIKAFAEGFKIAADFIGPVLDGIAGAIKGFINTIHDAFEGFYTWLVGGSLWMDMWNALASVASTMISALLGDLGSKFFDPMKDAFTGAMRAVEDTWNTSWQAVQSTFDTITSQIQTGLNTRFDEMKTFVTANLGEYAPIANDALSAMQAAANAVMSLIHGDWQGFLDGMSQAMYLFWNVIQGATTTAFGILQTSFTRSMDTVRGILDSAINAMQGLWQGFTDFISHGIEAFQGAVSAASDWLSSTLSMMQSTATSVLGQISDAFMSTVNSLVSAAQSLWNSLVGGSIWTDMLEEMQAQTYSALGNIAGAFQGMSLAIPPTIPYAPATTSTPAPAAPTSLAGAAGPLALTIPITVQVDSQTIAKQVENRIVSSVSNRSQRRG